MSKNLGGRPRSKNRKDVKEHVVTFRVTPREMDVIKKAAKLYDWTPREFYRQCVITMALKAVHNPKKEQA